MSRSRLQDLEDFICEGQLKINQLVIREPKTRLKIGGSIEVFCRNRLPHAPKGKQ